MHDSAASSGTPDSSGTVVVRPSSMDCSGAAEVRERLLILLNRGAEEVVLDLSGTEVCACCGAPAVVRAHRRARALGASLVVVAADAETREAIERAGLYEPEVPRLVRAVPRGRAAGERTRPVSPVAPAA
jgi:anti-anti-sigma factor